MTEGRRQPKISLSLTLEPSTHSFSSSQAPKLNVMLTLDFQEPITIYEGDLRPFLLLNYGALAIHDFTTGVEVQHPQRTHCMIPPPSKVQVDVNPDLFHTLLPSTAFTLSTPFTRPSKDHVKPRAASDPEYCGGDHSCGVDGLEINRQYVMKLAHSKSLHYDRVRWWEYGTKEKVLGSGNLDAREVRYGSGPHQPIEVDTSQVHGVVFQCVP